MKALTQKILLLLFLFSTASLFSQSVKAELKATEYNVGDTVEVDINMAGITGLHGIYFDLEYDSEYFIYDGLVESDFIIENEGDLLYSVSEFEKSHVILSYSLKNPGTSVNVVQNKLVTVKFKIKGDSSKNFTFKLSRKGIKKSDGSLIDTTVWSDSQELTIANDFNTGYVAIKDPYENQVFLTDYVEIDAISTPGTGYYYILTNLDGEPVLPSDPIPASSGYISNYKTNLNPGFNRIKLELFNADGQSLDDDVVRVYKSDGSTVINIKSPMDHSVVNTNLIEVKVDSSYDKVKINGSKTVEIKGETTGFSCYSSKVWLKKGFNRIKAEVRTPDGALFTDEIEVYYQEDDSIFTIIPPNYGEIVKSNDPSFKILGEISSKYESKESSLSSNLSENKVTLSMIYYPDDLSGRKILFLDKELDIRSSVREDNVRTKYVFTHTEDLSLLDYLSSGKIEITAYKNRNTTSEVSVKRLVNIDDSEIKIELIQPNIYNNDILDSQKLFDKYTKNSVLTGIHITSDGSYKIDLKDGGLNVTSVTKENKSSPVSCKDINDTLWYVDNTPNGMIIKKKTIDKDVFQEVKTVNNMYGYTISETSFGILIGVSNLYNNENSGLYLLDPNTNELKNIRIGEPIPHVQFIHNFDGQILLYGNNYDYLYSFNTQNLEDHGTHINSLNSSRIPLNIDYNIKDIQVTSDLKMAIVLDENGKVKFYQNMYTTGFEEVYITDFDYDSESIYTHLIKGEYKHSDYNAFLLLGNTNRVIMQNKDTGTLKCSDLSWEYSSSIVGADFFDDNFVLVTLREGMFVVSRGALHFNNFSEDLELEERYNYTETYDVRSKIFVSNKGIYIDSINPGLNSLNLAKKYKDNGSISFTYNNPAIDGVTGFSFYTEPGWLESNVNIGMKLGKIDETSNTLNTVDISSGLLNALKTNSNFKEVRSYIEDDLEYVEFIFKDIVDEFSVNIALKSKDYQSPYINGLKINNKAPFKLIKSAENLSMPIRGIVNDPTVKEIKIGNLKVKVIDGKFYTIYPLVQVEDSDQIEINLLARNSIGDEATLSFNVDMIDSFNGIHGIEFTADNVPVFENYKQTLNSNMITVSGNFFGLKGAILGYELYKGTNSDLNNTFMLRSGIIKKDYDAVTTVAPGNGIDSKNIKFYDSGSFSHDIKLNPGIQTLIIYIENPGGLRTNITKIDNAYPELTYKLPVNEEKIDIETSVEVEIFESSSFPYVYEKDVILTGDVVSPYTVDELIAEIVGDVGTFEDGKKEIRISVNSDNSFQIPLNVKLPEECELKDIIVKIKPNTPFLDSLKTSVSLKIKKNFENSNIIPDFTYMDSWLPAEKKKMSKLITLGFTRYIPEDTELSLLINFDKYIKGKLKVADNTIGTYYLVDDYDNPISLSGIRLGSNRVNWTITCKGYVISSSNDSTQSEYTFNFDLNNLSFAPTAISFTGDELEGGAFTDTKPFPILNISKDINTQLSVKLNSKIIWEDGDTLSAETLDLNQFDYLEGKNRLAIEYTERGADSQRVEYGFTYDSKEPQIGLESEIYSDDGSSVSLSFLVLEANLSRVVLNHNGTVTVDSIESVGLNRYRVKKNNMRYTAGETVTLKAEDHSGKFKETAPLTLTGKLFEVTTIDNKNISLPPFNNEQTFHHNPDLTSSFNSPYSKVFPSVIKLKNEVALGVTDFAIKNVQKIEINKFTHGTNNLDIQGYEIELNPGYESQGEVTFTTSGDLAMDTSLWEFNHDKDSVAIAFTFWFRDESQDYYMDSSVYKVLKLDANNTIYCDGSNLFLNNEIDKLPINEGIWNFIGVKVQDGSISITKRNNLTDGANLGVYTEKTYSSINIADIISGNATYRFGSDTTDTNGYFSVALPYYVNNKLKNGINDPGTISSLEEIYNFVRITSSSTDSTELDRIYNFDKPEEQGENFRQFKPITADSTVLTGMENTDYTQKGGKALIASSVHSNILRSTHSGISYVDMDSKSSNPDSINLTVFKTDSAFLLSPINLFVPGSYYFDSVNSESNRGLSFSTAPGADNNFTLSGRILPYNEATNLDNKSADIVVTVNFDKYRYPVNYGDFHVILNSEELNITDTSKVHISIETENRIYLEKDVRLNRGTYRSPVVYKDSAVQFESRLNTQGTVAFWYKPFNINKNGFTNYETVLFHNNYIKIYTEYNSQTGVTEYKAKVGPNPGVSYVLNSSIPVESGWQHIQLSYSQPDHRASLYINGELALNGNTVFDAPEASISYTTLLGCDMTEATFAEGYIDEFLISPFYKPALFKDLKPFNYKYVDNPDIKLDVTKSESLVSPVVTTAEYILESRDREFKKSVYVDTTVNNNYTNLPFDFDSLKPGRYTFSTKMNINGYNFNNTKFFIRNDKPLFILEDTTSFIIPRKQDDVTFRLRHDNAVHIDNSGNKKSGIKIALTGQKTSGEVYTKEANLFQDVTGWKIKWDHKPAAEDINKHEKGYFDIIFTNIESVIDLDWEMTPYYYTNNVPDTAALKKMKGKIQKLNIADSIRIGKLKDGTPYKLILDLVSGSSSFVDTLLNDIEVKYEITSLEDNIVVSTDVLKLKDTNGIIELYYDDFLKNHGKYKIYFSVYYLNDAIQSKSINVLYEDTGKSSSVITAKNLNIDELSFISVTKIDSQTGDAKINFKYSYNAIPEDIKYNVKCYADGVVFDELGDMVLDKSNNDETFNIKVPPGNSVVRVELKGGNSFKKTSSIEVANDLFTPDIEILTSIPFILPYNNLTISWIGTFNGTKNSDIKYSYNLDNRGWTPLDSMIKTELYNLVEENHSFRVKAVFNGIESKVKSLNFYIDTVTPQIADEKIIVTPIENSFGVVESVNVTGLEGAVIEKSVKEVLVNGTSVVFGEKGGFNTTVVKLEKDGLNKIDITVEDNAGNIVNKVFDFETKLINIIYPKKDDIITNTPVTIVGNVPSGMNLEVYVKDPLTGHNSDYKTWKKAKFNGDGTFFVEDIYIHPGTDFRPTETLLNMIIITEDGSEYKKDITLEAGDIRVPIDINFSSSAIEGKNSQTEISIDCFAEINNITSWSIDFNGDGIYDDIDIVSGENTKSHSWTQTYSTVGLVTPRVRIITANGQYLSSSKELIIHDSILQASNKVIDKPISVTVAKNSDQSHTVFALYGDPLKAKLDIYTIEKNDVSISERKSQLDFQNYGIVNPVKVKALDAESVIVASNENGTGKIILLKRNEYGQFGYYGEGSFDISGVEIKDITADTNYLYITLINSNIIYKYPHEMGVPLKDSGVTVIPKLPGDAGLSDKLAIGTDFANVYLADYYNQRIVILNQSLNAFDYFGTFGIGEGEFLKPSIIKSYGERLFVYDESRKDIQVFDKNSNKLLTKLAYDSESQYFESDFLIDLADMDIITKEEGDKIYYYGILFSRSTNKLGLLRLPKWEEYRAKVRNNRIAFIKDKELFISKTTGSDLKKILSSDAIPNIEGSIDYPSLSPDGHKVVFTSRRKLNSGSNITPGSIYNNLYISDVDNADNLHRIPLGEIDNFEIERPVFNANGDKVIFSAKKEGENWQIYTYSMVSGGVHRLFTSNENARFPYYSPDDRYVVFTTDVDGDEEIEIFDTQNTSLRIQVSSNNARDYYPVWSELYPYEISNKDYNIESKIAFSSEKNYKKEVFYVYIARKDGEHPRVVTKTGLDIDGDPDSAWIKVSDNSYESNYPCFSGDGSKIVYEAIKLNSEILLEKDLKNGTAESPLSVLDGARRPAGMKNKITGFNIETKNGNDALLTWNKYTDSEVSYYVEYRADTKDSKSARVKVFNQDSVEILDLIVGQKYKFRVFIMENNEEAASTSWRDYTTPAVAALPTVTVDENNPYLVHLHAWQPNIETKWKYSWLIDNREINAQSSQDYYYEYGTSGPKTIVLKASTNGNTYTSVSDPVYINIVSDIIPVIEYTVSNDNTYVELTSENSKGIKIDEAATNWQISGPGSNPEVLNGTKVIVPLDKFKDKINVNLTLRRISVSDQQVTDTVQRSVLIDINYKETKPVITYNNDDNNSNLVHFSGQDSLGNIDWPRASWKISSDGAIIHSETGVSTLSYDFRERGTKSEYVVSLTVPRQDGLGTATTTSIISLDPKPIVPKIDYEILTLEQDGNVVGAKLVLSAAKSAGTNIDFSQTRWTVPVASSYGEQATQIGPTAVYNLMNIEESANVEVNLTMMRRGGNEVITINDVITLKAGELPRTEINVNVTTQISTSTGEMFVLDILNSTGPNIDWEKTKWQFGDVTKVGPVVRIDRPSSTEKGIFRYICSAYTKDSTKPIIKRGQFESVAKSIEPTVTENDGDNENSPYPVNVKKLDVLSTIGKNIDWTRTEWLISDGGSQVIRKVGASIIHAFPFSSISEVYNIQVNMFLKGDAKPFTKYHSVDVEADYIYTKIKTESAAKNDEEMLISNDDNKRRFTLEHKHGQGIDLSQTTWTFSDNPAVQSGATVVHFFPVSSTMKQYEVTATVKRNLSNGEIETYTTTSIVTVNGDFIVPDIALRNPTQEDNIDSKMNGLQAELIFSVKDSYCNVDTDEFDDRIYWEKTKWSISNGNGGVVQRTGSEIYYIFPATKFDTKYTVAVEMFLKDSSLSFTKEISVDIVCDELTPLIGIQDVEDISFVKDFSVDKVNGTKISESSAKTNIKRFSAEGSEGANIEWDRCKWNFGDGTPEQFGPVVFHEFPDNDSGKTYDITLTIFRTTSNGLRESSSAKLSMDINANIITPVITWERHDDGYFTFSSEDSSGIGIDHDEAQWYFFYAWEDDKNDTVIDGGMSGNVFSQEYNWIPKQISNGTSVSRGRGGNSGSSFFGLFSSGSSSSSSSGTSSNTSMNTDFSLWGKQIKRNLKFTEAEEDELIKDYMNTGEITKQKDLFVVLQFYKKTKQGEMRKGAYIIEKFDIYELNKLDSEYLKPKAEELRKEIEKMNFFKRLQMQKRYQSRGPKGPH